ncbi:uncharacterized protein LOC120215783 [Hibiscus syriacus]|uniref:uncharacterized protein LOC120215783 n=1 Tax=Hibiscus syriacus TaxID=106335 RepID=UPI001921EDBA|nr:uncharacterized protein LOC120215783 [Hibiscus syriacus]
MCLIPTVKDVVGSDKVLQPTQLHIQLLHTSHKHLDSDVICAYVKLLEEKNPRILVSMIVASIRNTFGYISSYYKSCMAKRKAITLLYGDWDQSYNELPHLLHAMEYFIPRTIVHSYTYPATKFNGQCIPRKRVFGGLFWAFKSQIEGFRYYKQMVQVDNIFLYNLYKHILMIAVAQDGDRNIFHIAFVIVKNKSEETWNFFMSNLRSHLVTQDGVCMISDRSLGLLATIDRPGSRWSPSHVFLAYCIRHIASNAMTMFKNKKIKKEIINIGNYFFRLRITTTELPCRTEKFEKVWRRCITLQLRYPEKD